MRLPSSIEKAGFFWLAANPDQQYPGNLRVSELGEITLEIVYRSMRVDRDFLHTGTPIGKDPCRIFGIVDSDAVVLQRCVALDDPLNVFRAVEGHVLKSIFEVGAAFVGATFCDEEKVTFSRVEFALEGLGEWFSMSGLRPEISTDTEKAEWSIHYKQPDDICIDLPGDVRLAFSASPSFSLPDYRTSQLSSVISQEIYVSLESDRLLPMEDYYNLIFKIHVFMCVIMNKVISIQWVKGFSKVKLDKWNREIQTNIFFRSYLRNGGRQGYILAWCGYREVSDSFKDMLLTWLQQYDKFGRVYFRYLLSKAGTRSYLEEIFMSYVQALESLHRRLSVEKEMRASEFEALQKTILEAVPDERRKFVKERLKHANEISLRKRLRFLVDTFGDWYGTPKEKRQFLEKVVFVRNYLTHHDESAEAKAGRIIAGELRAICEVLESLLVMQFLSCAGMDVERIKTLAAKNPLMRRGLRQADPVG